MSFPLKTLLFFQFPPWSKRNRRSSSVTSRWGLERP